MCLGVPTFGERKLLEFHAYLNDVHAVIKFQQEWNVNHACSEELKSVLKIHAINSSNCSQELKFLLDSFEIPCKILLQSVIIYKKFSTYDVSPWGNYLTQTTIQSWISRILMQKTVFFRFSSNCPRCYRMMLKRFLGALRHSKQPPELLNTPWDHLKKRFFIEFSTFGSHFLLIELTNPLKMAFYEGFQNLKAFSRRKLWLRYDREASSDHITTFCRADFV